MVEQIVTPPTYKKRKIFATIWTRLSKRFQIPCTLIDLQVYCMSYKIQIVALFTTDTAKTDLDREVDLDTVPSYARTKLKPSPQLLANRTEAGAI